MVPVPAAISHGYTVTDLLTVWRAILCGLQRTSAFSFDAFVMAGTFFLLMKTFLRSCLDSLEIGLHMCWRILRLWAQARCSWPVDTRCLLPAHIMIKRYGHPARQMVPSRCAIPVPVTVLLHWYSALQEFRAGGHNVMWREDSNADTGIVTDTCENDSRTRKDLESFDAWPMTSI